MKKIPLTQGKVALVDDEDYERVSRYTWYAKCYRGRHWYAARNAPKGSHPCVIKMHRFILEPGPGQQVDHINHDGLDNRKDNIRSCTPSGNAQNSLSRPHSSRFKGVTRHYRGWEAQIEVMGKKIHLGTYGTEEEAYEQYCSAARRLHGEFANLY